MSAISKEGFKLLEGLEQNNEREWFKPRKEQFDELLIIPFAELLESLSVRLDLAGHSFKGGRDTMFRMQRDTRFSKDKSPYKSSISGMLTPSGTKKESDGCIYLHLSPSESFAAFGRYNLNAKALGPIRDKILDESSLFSKILSELKGNGYDLMRSQTLSSMPRGYSEHADHPLANELRLKNMMVRIDFDRSLWHQDEVVPLVAKTTDDCAEFLAFIQA